jgi:hypothetical protein
MMDEPTGCSTWAVALGGLATYSVAVVFIVLIRPYLPPLPRAPQVVFDYHLHLSPG